MSSEGGTPVETKESYNLEFKESVTKTFLKTVSAYANYNDGTILFGVDDNGNMVGVKNAQEEASRIENMINDSLAPVPDFNIQVKEMEGAQVIHVTVKKGKDTPYAYQGKIYRRADTSTMEVNRFELRRLALEGIDIDYESRKASSQNLSFNVLESWLKEAAGIKKISLDILKTLSLFHKDGYFTIAGELLADKNEMVFSGIDIVKFGQDINKILYRETISKASLLTQYQRALEIFEQYYLYEEIQGYERIQKELIPKEAFWEALANAMVHRVWDINSYIQIAMFEDRIEINSPGGLPDGTTEAEYLLGNISVLRNPIIAGVFNRLHIIEKFGTGIARINKEYRSCMAKPAFHISENRIRIVLPVMDMDKLELSDDEQLVYSLFKEGPERSRRDIDTATGFDKAKTIRILNNLVRKNILRKEGGGIAVTYILR
jgi:ATP-dependent DNA helicase RecG